MLLKIVNCKDSYSFNRLSKDSHKEEGRQTRDTDTSVIYQYDISHLTRRPTRQKYLVSNWKSTDIKKCRSWNSTFFICSIRSCRNETDRHSTPTKTFHLHPFNKPRNCSHGKPSLDKFSAKSHTTCLMICVKLKYIT